MAVSAIALAFIMLTLKRAGYYGQIEKWSWIYTGGADVARVMLSAVANTDAYI